MSGRHRASRPARHSRRHAAVASWVLLAAGLLTVVIVQYPIGVRGALEASAVSVVDEPDRALAAPRMAAPLPNPVGDGADEPAPSVSSDSDGADDEVERPLTLAVGDIGVKSDLQPLGLNADGSLEVPTGPLYDQAGWYTGSPRPGEVGPAVLLGHVTGNGGQPSVFYRLSELRAGQLVTVDRVGGSQAQFEVYRVEQYPKDSFPTAAVYGDTSEPELRLITCAGVWDVDAGSHRDNIVVYAKLVSIT